MKKKLLTLGIALVLVLGLGNVVMAYSGADSDEGVDNKAPEEEQIEKNDENKSEDDDRKVGPNMGDRHHGHHNHGHHQMHGERHHHKHHNMHGERHHQMHKDMDKEAWDRMHEHHHGARK